MIDSASRWRMVRKLRRNPKPEPGPAVIRSAKLEDMGLVADIYNFYVRNTVITFDEQPWDVPKWISKFEHLEKLEMPFLVLATSSGEVIGFAYVAPWREKAAFKKTVENSVYLRPGAIGKGYGKALMTELIRLSTEAGIKEIIAVISDSGADASIALHKKMGFEQQGHLGKVGFKFGRWLGTVLLQKSLK